MEGDEKLNLELGSRSLETVLGMATSLAAKQQDDIRARPSSEICLGQGIELAASNTLQNHGDVQQLIPSAVSVPMTHTTTLLEGSSTSLSTVAVSNGMLQPNISSGMKVTSGCVLPSIILALDESHAQQPASHPVAVLTSALPIMTAATESGPSVFDPEEKPLTKEEKSVDKCKVRKRPRQLLQDARAQDVRKSREKQPVIRWKDVWVAQLIHIRGRMHPTFTSPQRQRVDLWQVVKHEMANSCFGFDKDSEACRKKWIRVYKEYKDDLHLSNDDSTQKCRFYDLLDFYMGNRANGFRSMPARPDLMPTAKDTMAPPLSNEVDIKANDAAAVMSQPDKVDGALVPHVSTDAAEISKSPPKKPHVVKRSRNFEKPINRSLPALEAPVAATSKRPHVKTAASSVQTMLSELVSIGKEMLQTTKEFEKEKLAVLHSIKDTLAKIAKNI